MQFFHPVECWPINATHCHPECRWLKSADDILLCELFSERILWGLDETVHSGHLRCQACIEAEQRAKEAECKNHTD